ncbi:LysR family transcriptional regulator [Paraferrimonas sedimenticola]|uniref:LysR family transcriptional regulator n=1 Tax=Paraferrimonas sedimenticola TaxID=375674 RepID=A0AA37W229_9GAMM|nr:LysR family transcriptional regulator [Paraferrimonas sedimenticola]GLP97242.1 LysR family transcriptional regulator [Paraferrimonas sedimenticola]
MSLKSLQLLDGMVLFSEVVSRGSFTAAANSLGYSTAYISKEIGKLEDRLGVRLLQRTTRKQSLTLEGQAYFQQCTQIIADAEAMQLALAGQQAEPRGKLRISVPVSFGLSKVRPILAEFTQRYPKVSLELHVDDRKVDMISEGFDVVIRASDKLEDSSLISRQLLRSRGVTLAAPSYLERFGTPKHPSELSQHVTFSYSNLKSPTQWQYHSPDSQPFTVQVNSQVITNSPEMELSLCLAGQGITRTPLFNLQDQLETGALVELFPEFATIPIGVYLVYPSRKHLAPKVRCFIDYVVEKIGNTHG